LYCIKKDDDDKTIPVFSQKPQVQRLYQSMISQIVPIFSRLYLVRSRLCHSVSVASVCRLSECIVAKGCVPEQKLLLAA